MLERIVGEAVALDTNHHRLHLELNRELWLLGNEHEIRSAVSNLIFNAVLHTPDGTEIWVKWHLAPQGPCLTVRDNGQGIDPQHIPRLTERFYRVDKGRSRASGGTGLGLAIVKHALNRHEAELHIASLPGEGSTFTCRFPSVLTLEPNQSVEEREKPAQEGPPPGRSESNLRPVG
jgi:two-component system phosphate regulon sensor histidine kinase PhoR